MNRLNYNPMLMMLYNLEPNVMVIADFSSWDETEDKLIAKAQEINLTMNNKLALGLMNMVNEQAAKTGILSQEAIALDAEANEADYYINYVVNPQMPGNDQKTIFENMKALLNIQEVVIRNDFMINNEPVKLDVLNEVFGSEHVHMLDGVKENYSIDALKGMLNKGDVRGYREDTGVNWSYKGTVVKGKGLGHTLGYPTANQTPKFKLPVKYGVYYSQVKLPNDPDLHNAMTCYWTNENGIDTLETYILDFDQDIYGWVIEIFFVDWMRQLKPAKNNEDIIKMLEDDEHNLRTYFIGEEN